MLLVDTQYFANRINRLQRLVERKSMFTATSWEFKSDQVTQGYEAVHIDLVRGFDGIKYAIRQMGACMDKNGKWDFEPLPSSRTDGWKRRFRFNTWNEAAEAIIKHLKNKPNGRFTK